ncbi:M23 family metallopeptidase [Solidesulfovibrio sp.]|uniref:M23 family metallopeptidase n=1 Tax=Solidesulfovibrio sp. TaxID=2910990 RepID=UPI00260F593D|nr:M23 family metallopeptidase [Solidesulfovibrio sp.]
MLERELEIYLRDGKGVRRVFTYRRWMFVSLVAALTVLTAGGLFLWPYVAGQEALRARRFEAVGRLAEQKAAALALRERVRRLAEEAGRIEAFDGKLAVMVDAPRERGGVAAFPAAARLPGAPVDADAGRRLVDFLDVLAGRMAVEEVEQQELARLLGERKLQFLAKPSLWPARGYITSPFGSRSSPFGRGGDFHNGVDIKVPMGSPVYAAGAGRVTEADPMTGYGLRIVVSHDYGLETVYAHLQKIEVRPGQEVKRGQRIGLSGNSGRTTGSHLHYEVRAAGEPVNPRQYMLD